jgi:hypothetical protein
MKSTFVRVLPSEWCLSKVIHGRRRQRLLHGVGFASIVCQIAKQATVLTHKRTRIRDNPGFYRAEITLQMAAETVDLFHNSAAGYRAQYYRSAKVGKVANKYAIRQLRPRVMELLTGVYKRTCPPWWVEKSLRHAEAKLWIHQGHWLRSPRQSDRNLMVKRWLESNPAKKRRQLWATLTPGKEMRIDLKGAPLTLAGKPLTKRLKRKRSFDIHRVGYT